MCGGCGPVNPASCALGAVGARTKNRDAVGDRRVIVHRDNLVRHRLEIHDAPKITQRRAGARAVGRQWPSTSGQIIDVDRAKIDAPAGERRLVAYGRMQLRAGEQDNAAGRHDQAHGWLEFERLLGVRLHPRVALHVLRGILSAIGIPAVVVEIRRTVLDGCAPVARMESHPLIGVEIIDRHPPVQLAKWRRVPSISMRMMGISEPGGEIVSRIGNAQSRHILKGLMRVASHIHKQALQVTPCLWMMDELRLESREDFHRLRHRELFMRMLRMARRECRLDLVARMSNQCQAGGAWRQNHQFALINAETALVVPAARIDGNVHSSLPSETQLPEGCAAGCRRAIKGLVTILGRKDCNRTWSAAANAASPLLPSARRPYLDCSYAPPLCIT